MKNCWENKKLKEIAALITDGDWIESRHQSEDGIRLIQTGNVGDGFFKAKDDKPHYISESTFAELGCTEVFEGDCLVSRLPEPVGRACIIPNTGSRMITAVDCSIIRFKDIILPSLFIYYTRSKRYQRAIYNSTTGTTRKRISRKNLESIQIPVPPLSEQKRIVAELDLLTGIIDKQKAQLQELDTLAQSIFYDMFGNPESNEKGWDKKALMDVCVRITDGSHFSPKEDENGIYPMLSVKDMEPNGFNYDKCKYINESDYLGLVANGCKPFVNDVLVAKDGSYLKTAFVQRDEKEQAILSSIAILTPRLDIVNPEYLSFFFKIPFTKSLVEKHYLTGTAIKRVILKGLKVIPIPVPPLYVQESFAQKIQSIESQKASINQSIAETQKLFDYTMDKYFG